MIFSKSGPNRLASLARMDLQARYRRLEAGELLRSEYSRQKSLKAIWDEEAS